MKPGISSANRLRPVLLPFSLFLLVSFGCGGTASLSSPPKALRSIAAAPAQADIAVGATEQFTATATYTDNSTADVTASVTWTDANPKVATIGPGGKLTAVAPGATTVVAAMDGLTADASLTVSAATKTLSSIAVKPSTAALVTGSQQQFSAVATYSDSSTSDVTRSVTWASSNPAVATITSGGLASAVAAGSVTITATLNGVTAGAALAVAAPARTLRSIALSPATATVAIGATPQFTAKATYSDNSTADVTRSATWSSSAASIATVSTSGLATAIAAGSVTITATLHDVSAGAALTVLPPPVTLSAIVVSPPSARLIIGTTQQFTAAAHYSDGTIKDVTAAVTWASSSPAAATISAAGLATAVAAGSSIITASLSGVQGAAALTVAPSLTAISVSPSPASVTAGATQQFTATAAYSDGSTQNVTATATWSSSNTSVATIDAAGLATAAAAGSAVITATLDGIHGSATLTVTPALNSISVSPNPATIATAATQQFTATARYSDTTTKDITATATWTSSDTSIATVNSSGLATGVAAGSASITATLNGVHGAASLGVTGIVSIAIAPQPASLAMNANQQLTATAKNSDGSTTDVTSQATWSVANTTVATVNANGLATGVAVGSTSVHVSFRGTSASLPITVTLPAGAAVNIPTWHVDNNRSGLNSGEIALTPANVAPRTFGKLFSYLVDGYAYAEPLLISNVTIKGSIHNVLYVATENDSVYAFDADNYGPPLWHTSLLQPGESPLTGATVKPHQGVTSTPVIDPASNTIYVVSAQASSGATYRLNALDITTGQPKVPAVTITASVPGTNSTSVGGQVSLPGGCVQRAALLLSSGTLYIGFGSCHSGWLLAYDATTLQQVGVFNASPNLDGEGTYGGAGGVWMGSGGPVADSAGNVYITTGNGPWDPTQGSWADSILKFNPKLAPGSSGSLVQDYFTPQDYAYMNCNDSDLAAGGLLMIPGSGHVVGGGKMGRLYLVSTANMGQEQTYDAGATTVFVEQGLINPYPSSCPDASGTHTVGAPNDPSDGVNSYEIFGTAAYFNGSIYLGVTPTSPTAPAVVRRFQYTSGQLVPQEYTSPDIQQNTRGTTPFISSNGNSGGILWMIDEGQPLQSPQPNTSATLRAYDAQNLSNAIYDSNQNAGDVPGFGIKFSSPVVANGKVYISTGHDPYTTANPQGEIDVYGLK